MIDWTDAFDNTSYVPGADTFAERLTSEAQAFRTAMQATEQAELDITYGPGDRNRLDLFMPKDAPTGLIVFVHGGYWHRLNKSVWSHLAAGAVAQGWAVAMPGYTLAPEVHISDISREIAAAIGVAAERVSGPIRLVGHSAGGHLVSRMMCDDNLLSANSKERLEKIVSVSGIHDLRPLLLSDMNATLHLTEDEAQQESPALHSPRNDVPITFWVGAAERPELIRQTRLIAEAWEGRNAAVTDIYEPGKNHFSVIESLSDAQSPLVQELLA